MHRMTIDWITVTVNRVLVVLGHPDPLSYNQALFEAYLSGVGQRLEVETLQLGQLDFDPVLRHGYRQRMPEDPVITRSQQLVAWADHLVLIYPCWWSATPALLKGWCDRVFTPGFAYNYQHRGIMALLRRDQHLAGRTATLIVTYDGPPWWFILRGTDPLRLVKTGLLGTCGITVTRTLRLGWTQSETKDSPRRRAQFLERVRAAGAGLA
jgi:putative NADPH-quinone reductase